MAKTSEPRPETPGEHVGVKEAAARLRVSVSTVQRYLDTDRLAGYRTAGGHRKITVISIERLYAETVGQREASGG